MIRQQNFFYRIHAFEILFRIWDEGAIGKENITKPSDLSLGFHHPSKSQMWVCISVTPTPEKTKSVRL